jgi:hypothetical protein
LHDAARDLNVAMAALGAHLVEHSSAERRRD